MEKSRDLWKHKYLEHKSQISKSLPIENSKAKHHSYPLIIVWFVVYLQSYGTMSLRCCQKSITGMLIVMGLDMRTPSPTSIRTWCCKLGYYRVHNLSDVSGSWVLIVDESITLNREKILLVLGVKLDQLPKGKSLTFSQVEVIRIEIHKKWKVEDITQLLEQIQQEREVVYVVSDQDHSLKKSYGLAGLDYISDCTHLITAVLKNLYKNDSKFTEFASLAGRLRKTWCLSKYASYSPPNQRAKCRFANIFPVVEWAEQILNIWVTLPEELQEKLVWLQEHKPFIEELILLTKWSKSILTVLKKGGYNNSKHKAIVKMMKGKQVGNALVFQNKVEQYLTQLNNYADQNNYENLFCCSDIIESTFGKFKHKVNRNSTHGLTEFVLTIANFTGELSMQEIKKGLENTQIKDLNQWKKERKKEGSIHKQKQEIFGKNWGKKSPQF